MNLPDTIIDAIKRPEITDLFVENAEVAFDSLLDDGTFKEIPVLGNLFKIYSLSQSVSSPKFQTV